MAVELERNKLKLGTLSLRVLKSSCENSFTFFNTNLLYLLYPLICIKKWRGKTFIHHLKWTSLILNLVPELNMFREIIFPEHLQQMFIFKLKRVYGCIFVCSWQWNLYFTIATHITDPFLIFLRCWLCCIFMF